MREAALPSPGTGVNGYQLRRVAAKSIGDIQKIASKYAGGKHPNGAKLQAFFLACAASLDTSAPIVTGAALKFNNKANSQYIPLLLRPF